MSLFIVKGVLFVVYKGGQATELADSDSDSFDDVFQLKNSRFKGVLRMHAWKAGALVL